MKIPRFRGIGSLVVCFLIVSIASPAWKARARTASPSCPPARTAVSADERNRSTGFEANRGQADARVEFLWRGANASLFLTSSEAVVSLESGDAVRMRFVGSNASAHPQGHGLLDATSNYLIGRDTANWRRGIERYARVAYPSLYPNVDLVFHDGDALEYDFVVHAGADASPIALHFDRPARTRLDSDGALVIAAPHGTLRHLAPNAYQSIGDTRQSIACRFVIDSHGVVRFALGDHDRSRPVVIDPQIQFSTYYGGNNADRAQAVALDASSNLYVVGRTFSPDFPTVAPAFGSNSGNYDAFVTKINANGSVAFSTYVGGGDFDSAQGVGVSGAGDIVFGGYTGSLNFPLASAFQNTIGGGLDGFVCRLDSSGASLLFSSYLGGSAADEVLGVAISPAGDAYLGGMTNSDNLLTTVGSTQPAYGGGAHDAFYAKVTGSALSTLSYLGGPGDDGANAIAIDASTNVYLTGFAGGVFPVLTPFQAFGGTSDSFVTKVDSGLATLAYSSYLGGSGAEIGTGIAVDTAGSAYLTGYTRSTNFPTVTPFQATNHGNNDGFVTKINAAGSAKVYSSYLGGAGDDRSNAIAVDQWGAAYVVGQTRSSDFPTKFPFQATNGGNQLNDVFATKIGTSGRIIIYSSYLGGSQVDVGYGVVADGSGLSYVVGYTSSSNYTVVSPLQSTNHGIDDAVVSTIVEHGDTPGIVDPTTAAWFLRNSSTSGIADISFAYGFVSGNAYYLAGDWNGDGIDTPGLYDRSTGTFFLRNSNTPGPANLTFTFGAANTYTPVAGDWDGDGVDTIGLYNPATGAFFLRNSNSSGTANLSFFFGPASSTLAPLSGDWNGDGIDTIGLYDGANAAWFLRDLNSSGPATYTFNYGLPGTPDIAIVGDWNADGVDTPGLYDPTTGAWFLRNSLTPGAADLAFVYGPPSKVPITGDWNN